MLTICTWLWGNKYHTTDVFKLKNGIKRHLKADHRFILLTEIERQISAETLPGVERYPIVDRQLLPLAGCFVRLRMFDPDWQRKVGVIDYLVCCDLDVIVTGSLDSVFDRSEPFVILSGANSMNPCPFNGSLMMIKQGAREDVFTDWTIEKSRALPYYEFPDDQGWLAHKIPEAGVWRAGSHSGVYAFKKPGWPSGDSLPSNARMVVFPGRRQPKDFVHLPWVNEHWR